MSEFDLFARLGAGKREFDEPICSRAGCEHPATSRIEWNNPRIHEPARIKIWLACDEHLAYLRDFLESREILVRVHAMTDELDELPIT